MDQGYLSDGGDGADGVSDGLFLCGQTAAAWSRDGRDAEEGQGDVHPVGQRRPLSNLHQTFIKLR